MFTRSLAVLSMMALIGCGDGSPATTPGPDGGGPDGGAPDGGIPTASSWVVDTDWLEAHLGDPDVQLVDSRATGYEESRIPGAIHLTPGELATTVDGISSQAAPPMQAQPVLRQAGLKNEVTVVVYGQRPEYDPGRIAWSLRYYGHVDVRYLDGGYAAWIAAGGAVETDPPSLEPSEYTIVAVDEDLRVTGDWVLSQLGEAPYDMPTIQLVDARSDGEYEAGHIPSARSVDWVTNLDAGFLRPEDELEPLYEGMDPTRTTVTYCLTGWRGAFAWLTLTALGYEDVRLYDGSWNEWRDDRFPKEP